MPQRTGVLAPCQPAQPQKPARAKQPLKPLKKMIFVCILDGRIAVLVIQNRRVPETGEKSSRQSLKSDREAKTGNIEETKVKKAIRGKVVHVRLSEEEFLALQAFSAKAGSNVSAVLRSLSQEVTAAGSIHRRDDRSAIKAYIGELRAIRGILDGIARDLRRGTEPQFDVLIDGMERLIRLVSEHALDLEVMSDATRHQDCEEEAGDV